MGWFAGEWVNGPCEDAPCCGCCGVAGSDDYAHERDEWDWYGTDDEDDWGDEDEDEESDYWQAEDSALESSLFGDC